MAYSILMGMSEMHPTNQALITILENQKVRTAAAFEELSAEVYEVEPGGDCNSIRRIGEHLINLRRFQLTMLESSLAEEIPSADEAATLAGLLSALEKGASLLGQAIQDHEPEDWYHVPDPPRDGKWGDEATIIRFTRPFNDFTNHLGGVRVIRRIHGSGVERTQ